MEYLEGWHQQASKDTDLLEWLSEFADKDEGKRLIRGPSGVLVAPGFRADAITKADDHKIAAMRLSRFRAGDGDYVIVENVLGRTLQPRTAFTWAEDGITANDRLYIEPKGASAAKLKLFVSPETSSLQRKGKRVVFEPESAHTLLERKSEILAFVRQHFPHEEGWVKDELRALAEPAETAISMTRATGLAFFAAAYKRSWWVFRRFWFLERTRESLREIERKLGSAE